MNRLASFTLGLMAAIPVAFLFGCYQVSHYSGDGQLVDNGSAAATDRYVLNLGPIDLTQPGAKTFRIENLPEANFVAGVEFSATPGDRAANGTRRANPIISLELSGPEGKILFTKKSALDAWTWSVPAGGLPAFVYGREEPRTYFSAAPKTAYTLTLNVLEPDRSQEKYTARLMMKSGGWK
jgi:hypothetical protein